MVIDLCLLVETQTQLLLIHLRNQSYNDGVVCPLMKMRVMYKLTVKYRTMAAVKKYWRIKIKRRLQKMCLCAGLRKRH